MQYQPTPCSKVSTVQCMHKVNPALLYPECALCLLIPQTKGQSRVAAIHQSLINRLGLGVLLDESLVGTKTMQPNQFNIRYRVHIRNFLCYFTILIQKNRYFFLLFFHQTYQGLFNFKRSALLSLRTQFLTSNQRLNYKHTVQDVFIFENFELRTFLFQLYRKNGLSNQIINISKM